MLNALTFDVEDYFHVHAFAGVIARNQWDNLPCRVGESTRSILRILREHRTRATFFVLGWIADRHPDLIKEIVADDHELASHGYAHEAVDTLTRAELHDDVARSLEAIGSACPDAPVRGYRAPSFSINDRTPWAFDVLADLGFTYDSSISPLTFHDRYGMPQAPRFAHTVDRSLVEIPVSTVRLAGCNWPIGGGGYFRLYPMALTMWGMRRIIQENRPAVVYLHPWEFDPAQPRITAAPIRSRFRHYVNLRHTEARLRHLLEHFSFGPVCEVFQQELARGTMTAARDGLPAGP